MSAMSQNGAVTLAGRKIEGGSHETTWAADPRAAGLHISFDRAFRPGQPDLAARAPRDVEFEHDDSHVSDQLRHAGNELPEFLPSERRRNAGGRHRGDGEYRRRQSRLFHAAARLQTAVLSAHSGRLRPAEREGCQDNSCAGMELRAVPLARLYDQHAEKCTRSAEQIEDPQRRALFFKLAAEW